jgi:hypothetical protein
MRDLSVATFGVGCHDLIFIFMTSHDPINKVCYRLKRLREIKIN